MQTLRKKTSPCKYRNDPGRFFGDGVTFKAKLIGILEVGEARGDRMCQEALQDLKIAIRAAGEHKQRITIHVTIDGLRLRDEKTGDSLYHHPVHKISFIAQDMTDSRAFGYIFGSPDSGHRFFGIKTDKAASQVVLAMRDLFQVVFELKKKEIELARQHLQSKTIHEHQPIMLTVKSTNATNVDSTPNKTMNEPSCSKVLHKPQTSPESVADLVDLEQELSSIQRGITQMERITPNEPPKSVLDNGDPFGDSFSSFPNLLPPPESSSSRSRHSKPLKPPEDATNEINPSNVAPHTCTISSEDWLTTSAPISPLPSYEDTKVAVEEVPTKPIEDLNSTVSSTNSTTSTSSSSTTTSAKYIDAFTELDPLGTGKIKPYVDKKFFFQDLKNPPKKVLKDLSNQSGHDSVFTTNFSSGYKNDDSKLDNNDIQSLESQMFGSTEISSSNTENIEIKGNDSILPSNAIFQQPDLFQNTSNDIFKAKFHNSSDNGYKSNSNKKTEDLCDDPFSSNSNKKIDPFMEDNDFSKIMIDPFEFEFNDAEYSIKSTDPTVFPDTKIISDYPIKVQSGFIKQEHKKSIDGNVFNGPLQVNLPPESWAASTNQKRCERQNSESSSPTSSIRNRPSVFKQNTVDVISSISTKKMKPYMFSQKFSKKDSNSINMRRLQESDSLSENETAPEPPPRPDSGSHVEPPPLPPKKQFSDIIIRPSTRNAVTLSSTDRDSRYAYISSKLKSQSNDNAPPLPLPSRKIGRPDTSFSIAARQARKCEDDDYLTPIPPRYDVPILLPPPQTKAGSKCRVFRKHDVHESKVDNIYESIKPLSELIPNDNEILPNITLTQLLTLGIDDLAERLNVPTVKLSIMTLVELTSYLSEFIENNKKSKAMGQHNAHTCSKAQDQKGLGYSVFKVSFDEENDATFVAKFDDNFGEDSSFVANFDNFEAKADTTVSSSSDTTTESNIDKYAVFRELLETGNQIEVSDSESHNVDESITVISHDQISVSDNIESVNDLVSTSSPLTVPLTKINTKITETIANAKDRYAALRDIILVEDLFEKPGVMLKENEDEKNEKSIINIEMDIVETDVIIETPTDTNKHSSPEINISDEMNDDCSEIKSNHETTDIFNSLQINKDDVEIDEYMNRAISNLSLDSRDHLSPIVSKSPIVQSQNASTSPIRLQNNKSPNIIRSPIDNICKTTLNDMSTSPIPIQKSPLTLSLNQRRSPLTKSPEITSKTSTPQPQNVALLLESNKSANSGSLSDIVCGSSPENDNNLDNSEQKSVPVVSESWAVFDPQPEEVKEKPSIVRSTKSDNKNDMESPCSSEGKNEWKTEQEYNRKWPKGQTSSSSRDVSPWDEDTQEYRRRPYSAEKAHHVRHTRRMNSCEDDFEYEEENMKRHDRRIKGHVYRNRDYYQEGPSWSKANDSNSWSPTEDDDEKTEHPRPFDRRAYERSTYGPPYDKREHKSLPLYERRDYKNFDKRKFYREEYAHPDYEFDMYTKSPESKERKAIYFDEGTGGGVYDPRPREYDEIFSGSFERSGRDPKASIAKTAREYYYERSFDRESMDSYESGGGPGRRSFGSGEIYGSLESRGDYRDDKRYMSSEKTRSLRKLRPLDNYEHDSESETMARRGPGDTRSLQRPPQSSRPRKTSASSPWDGEDVTPTSGTKSWKRPSSASESDRRIVDNRKILINPVSGSDGEKDRRFRKKTRNRGSKETDYRSNYATLRSTIQRREDDYLEMEEPGSSMPRNLSHFPESDVCNKRLYENEYYRKQRQQFYKSTTPRSEGRTISDSLRAQDLPKRPMKFSYDSESERLDCMKNYKKGNMSMGSREMYYDEKEKPRFNFDDSKPITLYKRPDASEFDEFEKMHKPPIAIPKNMGQLAYEEEQGFESDFNSPSNTKVFRFSNDFSDKDSPKVVPQPPMTVKQDNKNSNYNFSNNNEYSTTSSAKLRFDDNIKVNKFDSDKHMFEDDFSKTEFDFENEDKWNDDLPTQAPTMKNMMHRLPKSHENIKKSESVNIFAKKSEDPFEDDDFFKQPDDDDINDSNGGNNSHNGKKIQKTDPFEWQKNFANFDQNI